MITITSPQNPKIKELVSLRESRDRRKLGLFVIEGARELKRALDSGYKCRTLYVEVSLLNDEARAICDSLPQPIQFGVTKEVFAKAAVREGSDGLLAVMETSSLGFDSLKGKASPFLLVLENLEKPGNFGALARSADGAGVDAIVVLDPKADLFNPNAIRASVGAMFQVPLIACTHDAFFEYCATANLKIYAATPHAKAFHFDADFSEGLALVLGSEAWGLSGRFSDARAIKIPMLGIADSLNVSVAGAVIMYEVLRQRAAVTTLK